MNLTSKKFQTQHVRLGTRLVVVWIGLIAILAACSMMGGAGEVPADLDYSTTRVSENGLYKVTYTPSEENIPVNQMHSWTLHVEDANGQPVEAAEISVNGDMPQHGHGLPTKPRVTQDLGNGDYLVEGLKFQMSGWWVMDFSINANGQSDVVHFNMQLGSK